MKKLILLTLSIFTLVSCKKEEKVTINVNTNDTLTISEKPIETNSGYKIGDEVSDFNLINVDDRMIGLVDYENAKGFIVIFTCNHCPYAKAYEDRIIALHEKYEKLGYPVIAINPNDSSVQPEDSFENMKIRAKEKSFKFAYLIDEGQEVYPKFGATKTPHVFILNKENNKNIVKYIGTIDNNYEDATAVTEKYVENAVDALLNNKQITTPTTVAIGCSIKTK